MDNNAETALFSQDNIDNRFLFVLIAAKRALQLQKGAHARVDMVSRKPTVLAMTEVMDDLVQYEVSVDVVKERKPKKKSKR